MYDLVIRNARIADGLGNPPVEGDLAVKDGRVAAIGRIRDTAAETVDAGGQVLAPGVIDLHTHYDAQLTWDKTASPSPALGVTTVVIGNCGFGIADSRQSPRHGARQSIRGRGDVARRSMPASIGASRHSANISHCCGASRRYPGRSPA
jgi:N-acyl-D-aspartate/D-glutamate deacylase